MACQGRSNVQAKCQGLGVVQPGKYQTHTPISAALQCSGHMSLADETYYVHGSSHMWVYLTRLYVVK